METLLEGNPPLWVVGGIVAFTVFLAVFLVRHFMRHDPARAAASCRVGEDGSFALELPERAKPMDVYFRFEIAGKDTDDDWDLTVGATLEGSGATVERTHGAHAPTLGIADATVIYTLHAGTSSSASFFLVTAPAGPRASLRGVARAGGKTRLVWGYVYAPRALTGMGGWGGIGVSVPSPFIQHCRPRAPSADRATPSPTRGAR